MRVANVHANPVTIAIECFLERQRVSRVGDWYSASHSAVANDFDCATRKLRHPYIEGYIATAGELQRLAHHHVLVRVTRSELEHPVVRSRRIDENISRAYASDDAVGTELPRINDCHRHTDLA